MPKNKYLSFAANTYLSRNVMKNSKKTIILGTSIIGVLIALFWIMKSYNKNYHVKVKSSPVYLTQLPLDTNIYQSIFAIENLNEETIYREFYKPHSKINHANFRAYVIEPNSIVYKLDQSSDSTIIKVAFYNPKQSRVIPPYVEVWMHSCLLEK